MLDVTSMLDEMAKEKESMDSIKQLTIIQVCIYQMRYVQKCSRTELLLNFDFVKVCGRKTLMPSLIASSILAAAQQMTGINGISFNMNNVYKEAGLSNQVIPFATLAVSGSVIFINTACVSAFSISSEHRCWRTSIYTETSFIAFSTYCIFTSAG